MSKLKTYIKLKTLGHSSEKQPVNTSKKHPRQGGQILVLMALLSTTLIILFGMVVGIGHLVQAKINLQNAVDLAAMSGASWQARYLNQLSLVNYRMRQNYKWVLYDLYVTQSRFNSSFKDEVGPASSFSFDRLSSSGTSFGICQQVREFCGGTIGDNPGCVSATTDLCQNIGASMRTIPAIVPSPIITDNPVLIAINASIAALGLQEQALCNDAANQNEAYFKYIMRNFDDRQRFQMAQIADVINEFGAVFGTGNSVKGNSTVGDQVIYQTFFDNLISANKSSDLTLEWLNDNKNRNPPMGTIPNANAILQTASPGGTFAEYFDRQRVNLKILYVKFNVELSGACRPSIEDIDSREVLSAGAFIGLSRSRNPSNNEVKIPLNVVLRATVKPRLLFWPETFTPTLVAVGAAKPFGSRIGPSAEQTVVETTGQTNENVAVQANMSFYPGDNVVNSGDSSKLHGVGHKYILNRLLSKIPAPDSGKNILRPKITGNTNCNNGDPEFICYALAPTLYEGFFWNTFPFGADINAAFSNVFGSLSAALRQTFPNELSINVSDPVYAMRDRSGAESALWHATTYIGNASAFQKNGKPVFFASSASALSSWTPSVRPDEGFDAADIQKVGRMGYQIKLVSLEQVCADIDAGGGSPNGVLSHYCDSSTGVFH